MGKLRAVKLNTPENLPIQHTRNGQCWWNIQMGLLLCLRKYSTAEEFVCSVSWTTSGKNCLEAVVQKEFRFSIKQRGEKKLTVLCPHFCAPVVRVCWGSQAECPGSAGQLRLGAFGRATWRRSDLLENASVQQSWATWHHGKQRYKDISTAVPPARAWHNTTLHFHKDLGLVMFLTSSKRLKPFWPLL